jgi:prepilin-type processing-associated H-X9-DG protein/prepilin-type N-terminal cleavage/methylation domain-containing protein
MGAFWIFKTDSETMPVTDWRSCCQTGVKTLNRDGLTLVEIMVVITIIGLLFALLLPVLSRAKARAQQIQCINNLHQFGTGLQNFLADNHGYISTLGTPGDDYPGTWLRQLQKYGFGNDKTTNFSTTGVWRCPAAHFGDWVTRLPPGVRPSYYVYNTFGFGPKTNSLGLGGNYNPNNGTYTRTRESDVLVPSEMMAFGDSFNGGISFSRAPLDQLENEGNTTTRHQGRGNVVFCDGHTESPTLQFLFTDTNDEALSRWNRDHRPHLELVLP